MKMSGTFKGRLTNKKTGEISCWEKHNLVVKAGFDWIADLMSNLTTRQGAISHIAFGTGASDSEYTMTGLQNEVYRATVTSSYNASTRELTFSGTLPQNSGLTVSITEVGLFNAATGGVMFDRATFSPKGIDENMSFDYEFVITLSE